MKLIEKDKKSIEIEVENLTETFLEPLNIRLLEDEAVDYANYFMGHPDRDEPHIFVRVKNGKPQTALKRCSRGLAKDFEDLKKQVILQAKKK